MYSEIIRVFVSSTWLDLQQERSAVEAALQRMQETKFCGMEYFGSRDEDTRNASLDDVRKCQVYLGIFGDRYGSGITKDEYEKARELGLKCLIYFKHESKILIETKETGSMKLAQLEAFKKDLRKNHTIAEFSNPYDLASKVTADLHRYILENYPYLSISQTKRTLINVPDFPPKFLPRPYELNAIKEVILAEDNKTTGITGTSKVGVQGMGGIGKSVLAAAVARDPEVREAFKDEIIWIVLGQQPELEQAQSDLYNVLSDEPIAFQKVQQGRIFLSKLLDDKNCLIILDDVWKIEHIEAFNVLGSNCKMLITTRDASIISSLGAEEYRLDVLKDNEARGLLASWADQDVGDLPAEALSVARECGNLPLALAMVGAMVRDNRHDQWANVLYKLRNADWENIRFKFPNYPYPDLLRAIEVSVDALEMDDWARKLNASTLYLDLAVFPEDAFIPPVVLYTLWGSRGLNKSQIQDLIDLFASRSLSRINDAGLISLHDVQLDYIRKQVGDLSKLHDELLKSYRREYPDIWPIGPDDGYFLSNLAYHLIGAGREGELKNIIKKFKEDGNRFCLVGIGGCGGHLTEMFLKDQSASMLGRLKGFMGTKTSEDVKGLWIEADIQGTECQKFFRLMERGYYPGFFIPHDVIRSESKTSKLIVERYGYDVKKQGLMRQAEFLKAVFEIFESDEDVRKTALVEYESENPIFEAAWRTIRLITNLGVKGNSSGSEICDGILFVVSLGGGTGAGFVNPITSYIRRESSDYPVLVLGVLTEEGVDPQQRANKEAKRNLAATISLYDMITKKVGMGVDGVILVDNQIMVEKFGLDYNSINKYISNSLESLVARGYYPDEKPDNLFSISQKFSDGLSNPPLLIPCYYRETNNLNISWDLLVEMALKEGQLFRCNPHKAERAYVFIRGFVDKYRILKIISNRTGLPPKRIELWRKLADGTNNEILILLRNPYGEVEGCEVKGNLEYRLHRMIRMALSYMDDPETNLISKGMPYLTKKALEDYFYGDDGMQKLLKESLLKIERGEKPLFQKERKIFQKDTRKLGK